MAFFQHVHAVMPLANAVDALRGALYFDRVGVLKPVLVLCGWIAGGAALLGLDAWLRSRRTTGRYTDDEDEVEEPPVDDPASEMPTPTALPVHRHHLGEPIPTPVGTVHDSEHQPVRGAAVTVMDTKGRQLVRTTTDEHGEYPAAGLPEGYLRIMVSSVGRNPLVHQKLLQSGAIVRADFALRSRKGGNITYEAIALPDLGDKLLTNHLVPLITDQGDAVSWLTDRLGQGGHLQLLVDAATAPTRLPAAHRLGPSPGVPRPGAMDSLTPASAADVRACRPEWVANGFSSPPHVAQVLRPVGTR